MIYMVMRKCQLDILSEYSVYLNINRLKKKYKQFLLLFCVWKSVSELQSINIDCQ